MTLKVAVLVVAMVVMLISNGVGQQLGELGIVQNCSGSDRSAAVTQEVSNDSLSELIRDVEAAGWPRPRWFLLFCLHIGYFLLIMADLYTVSLFFFALVKMNYYASATIRMSLEA